jgi:phosphatidylinositol glycan class M
LCSFGLAVHFKIYPVIYSLAIFLSLGERITERNCVTELLRWRRWRFALVSAVTCVGVSALCYAQFGDAFLRESYLYHVSRQDPRHNFSVHFYHLYLNSVTSTHTTAVALLPFAPQLVLVLVFSVAFRGRDSLHFGLFASTFAFVTFNKVCTVQVRAWSDSACSLQ